MKTLRLTLAALTIFVSLQASAQFAAIANQLPNLITPALSGSMSYRGFVEAEYLKGIGNVNVDFAGVSTSQGFQYADWFFMGVGLGVQYVHSNPSENWLPSYGEPNNWHGTSTNGCMVPVFTDFRFNIGKKSSASFYADLKIGASFLMGGNWLSVSNGYITNSEYFYLHPQIGVRIPVNSTNPKQAVNIGASYQLLTADYWYNYRSSQVVNSLGVNLGFEW